MYVLWDFCRSRLRTAKERPRPGVSWLVRPRLAVHTYATTWLVRFHDIMLNPPPNKNLQSYSTFLCENQVWSFSTLRSYVLVRTSSLCGSQVWNLSNRKCSTLWSYVRVRTSSNDCSCVASTNHPSVYVKFVNYSEFVCCTANYKHMYLHFLPCLATL